MHNDMKVDLADMKLHSPVTTILILHLDDRSIEILGTISIESQGAS